MSPHSPLVAPAAIGHGTCSQSGQHGDRRTQAVPGHSPSPTTIGSDRTVPDVRSKRTTRNGGPEPAKRATNPRAELQQRDPSARKVPRSGPTSQPKGRCTTHRSRRREARVPRVRWRPSGPLPHGHPARNTTTPCTTQYDSDLTPKAYRLGVETTTHQSAASGRRPGA